MASMTPLMKFNEIIRNIGDMAGGIHYYSIYNSGGDQTQVFRYGDVKEYWMDDVDPDVNNDFSTAVKKEVTAWSNGSKLYAYFWVDKSYQHTVQPLTGPLLWLRGTLRIENGQNVITPPNCDFGNIDWGNQWIYSDYGDCISSNPTARPVKMAWITQYDGSETGGAVENLTEAQYLALQVMIPTGPEGGNSCTYTHVESNKSLFWKMENGYPIPNDMDMIYYDNINACKFSMCLRYDDMDDLVDDLNSQAPIDPSDVYKKGGIDDPIQDTDPSTPGGGGGNFDDKSDPIDFPAAPTGGAISSGALKAFVVSAANMTAFFNKLWNISAFDIATQFQKLVNEPMQCIISLHCLPCLPTVGSSENIKLGSFDTEVTAPRVTGQYVAVDCGTINLKEFWGSALDYAPYTNIEIFLPFVGIRQLKIEDAQNSAIHVKYMVDSLTGSCVAFVKCGQSVLYTFTGNCLQNVPVTSQSSDLLKNNITAVGAVGVGIATGNAPVAIGGALAGMMNTATAKNHVQRSGDLAGAAGMLGEFKPYLIIHRPIQSLAADFKEMKGYPANITYTLNQLKGYTEVTYVHLTGISGATDAELNEIESMLKSGVII